VSEPVVVVQETEDGLYQEKWIFNWSGHNIVLQRYHKARRNGESWLVTHMYDVSGGDYGNWTWIKESEVPWDDELKSEVAHAVVSKIWVGLPSEFRSRRS
jgi:hypothetical protein